MQSLPLKRRKQPVLDVQAFSKSAVSSIRTGSSQGNCACCCIDLLVDSWCLSPVQGTVLELVRYGRSVYTVTLPPHTDTVPYREVLDLLIPIPTGYRPIPYRYRAVYRCDTGQKTFVGCVDLFALILRLIALIEHSQRLVHSNPQKMVSCRPIRSTWKEVQEVKDKFTLLSDCFTSIDLCFSVFFSRNCSLVQIHQVTIDKDQLE